MLPRNPNLASIFNLKSAETIDSTGFQRYHNAETLVHQITQN